MGSIKKGGAKPRSKASIKNAEQQVNSVLAQHPVFCFQYLQKGFETTAGQDKQIKDFVTRVEYLSKQNWGGLNSLGKDKGFEKLDTESLKTVKVPSPFLGNVRKVDVARFGGSKYRMIGVIRSRVFHIIWVDYKLKLYNH